MKFIGFLIIIAGFYLLGLAFTMDTSVAVDYPGGNDYGLPERVNNLGLMADKQNYMIFGAILTILGFVTIIAYDRKSEKEEQTEAEKTCPKCAENVKQRAQICRYCNHSFVDGD